MDNKAHIYDDLRARENVSSSNINNPTYENFDFPAQTIKTSSENNIKITRLPDICCRNRKSLCCMLFGLLLGTIITSIVSVTVMNNLSKTRSQTTWEETYECLWTTWSSWTNCSAKCKWGSQYRIKQQTTVSKNCKGSDLIERKNCFLLDCDGEDNDMTFDRSSLYKSLYISDDNKSISTHLSERTPHSPDSETQFKTYQGVAADKCFNHDSRIYYEVTIIYKLTKAYTDCSRCLILEVGVAERDMIDNYHKVSSKKVEGWSYALAQCGSFAGICLWARHLEEEKAKVIITGDTNGTSWNGQFGIFLNRMDNTFSLLRNFRIFYTFRNVTANPNTTVCPVFAVYNSHVVQASIEILNSKFH